MAGPRLRPHGTEFWPAKAMDLSPTEIVRAYEDGFCGAYEEPEEREAFESEIVAGGGRVFGSDIANETGIADSGKGKLSIPFVFAIVHFPGCLPGPAQDRGDCVSHDQKNANLCTYACEIQAGLPDEVSGKPEEAPKIPPRGLKEGAFSTEVYYWFRRHGGDGWSCDAAARVAMKEAGLVTRDNHTESIGVDLTEYSGKNAGIYGRTPPSGSVAAALDNNLIRTATTLNSREERRDFIANGYCLSTCGMEGFSNQRDENGVSGRRGTWAHAMAFIGFDDRESTKSIYDDSLELVQNSWAVWNSGPRDIRDSASYVDALCRATGKSRAELVALDVINSQTGNVMIPKGSFWARSRDVSRRRAIAKSGVAGWPKRDLWIPRPFVGVI